MAVCSDTTVGDCSSLAVELSRQQFEGFPTSEGIAFELCDTNTKHCPILTVTGTVGTVVVGKGAVTGDPNDPIHPMTASSDPNTVHWIDHIYVKDQDGNVVAMRDLGATESSPATLVFDIPAGVTSLTPYEHCNLHGLYKGVVVSVTAVQTSSKSATCSARFCPGDYYISAPTTSTTTTTTTTAEPQGLSPTRVLTNQSVSLPAERVARSLGR